MKTSQTLGMALAGLLGLSGHAATAAVILVDADPATIGVQNTRTVNQGANFSVDVVLDTTGVGADTVFDTTSLGISFNDAGAILSSLGASAGAVAGAPFISGFPGLPADLFGIATVAPGAALTMSVIPPGVPAAGFASTSGLFGLFDSPFTVPADTVTTLFSFAFSADAAGTSTLLASNTDAVLSELELFGSPIDVDLVSASVTVMASNGDPNAVPVPGSMLLFGSALLGFAWSRRRQRA